MTLLSETTAPQAGIAYDLQDGLRFILAPNANKMTYWGTNTYLLGKHSIAVIDPGPMSDTHLQAILDATQGQTVTHIIVTHSHKDHSSLAPRLAQATGAPIYARGPYHAGRSDIMQLYAKAETRQHGGLDTQFTPDITLNDKQSLTTDEWSLTTYFTPGHCSNHIAFTWKDVAISGDTIMGWSSSIVSPPDGDMGDFVRSCKTLLNLNLSCLYTGHGAPLHAPNTQIKKLIVRQYKRQAQLLKLLRQRPHQTSLELTAQLYKHLPQDMHHIAERNILAHLIELCKTKKVSAKPSLSAQATFVAT